MFEHLTQSQIENYGRAKLSAAELLLVSDHLGACQACRGQLEGAMGGDAAFFALRSGALDPPAGIAQSYGHPAVEQIAEYVDGVPGGEQLQVVRDHLSVCEQCALAVDDLVAFKNQVAPGLSREYRPASPRAESQNWKHRLVALLPPGLLGYRPAFIPALTVLVFMLTGWLVWQAQQKKDIGPEIVIAAPPSTLTTATPPLTATASPAPQPKDAAPLVIVQLNDGGGRIMLDQNGRLSGVDDLPPAWQRMVKESLTNQRIARSSLLAGLNRPASALMGEASGNDFSVTEPVGKVMLTDRPTFRWKHLEGASGYVIEVYDEAFNMVAASPRLTDRSWAPPQPLKRGGIYSWQVKAFKDGQEFRSPSPPAPQAKFRILDQARVDELTRARQAWASSHLTLGLLYAEAGLLDQAENELRALQKANPDSMLVRRLLIEVQKLRV